MRKYIKSMREQFDNNSVIFKQAKKMFHYVPSTADNRHFGVTKQNKTKNDHEHLIKDDYSSVKDLKNENNEINESSWIAKLVNGIQEHSLEEVRGPQSQEFKGKASSVSDSHQVNTKKQNLKSVKSENIVIITSEEKLPLQSVQNMPLSVNQHPTKKNSYNFKKKSQSSTEKTEKTKHKYDRSESFCENSKISQTKSRKKSTGKEKDPKRKGSQSEVKCTSNRKKDLGPRKKSLQDIYIAKIREEKSKSAIIDDELKLSDVSQVLIYAKTKSKGSGDGQKTYKMNESLMEMEEIKCLTDNKEQVIESNNFFRLSYDEPLFGESNRMRENSLEKAKTRLGCGSIRKNSKQLFENREKEQGSFKQESTQAIYSPKFSSASKIHQEVVVKREEDEIISATEEKRLVDKYLKSSYNSRNLQQAVQPFRKESKRYKYEILPDKNLNNDIEVGIPQKKDTSNRPYSKSYFHKDLLRGGESSNHIKFQQKRYSDKAEGFYSENETAMIRNTCRHYEVQPQERNKKQEDKTTRRISAVKYPIEPQNRIQQKSKIDIQINKNAYLASQTDSTMIDPPDPFCQKRKAGVINHERIGPPSKYSYIALNSAKREESSLQDNFCSGQKSTSFHNVEGSDLVIDRLNSKLSCYISQHNLDSDRPKEWDSEEPTHRAMHLDFKELKKHGSIKKH